jgi:hypothetical protein
MNVSVIGKLDNGTDFTESDSFAFAKGVEPKTLGITLAGRNGQAIRIGDW